MCQCFNMLVVHGHGEQAPWYVPCASARCIRCREFAACVNVSLCWLCTAWTRHAPQYVPSASAACILCREFASCINVSIRDHHGPPECDELSNTVRGPSIAPPRDKLAKGALFRVRGAKSTQYFMLSWYFMMYKIMKEPLVARSWCFVSAAQATKDLSPQ